MKRYGLVLIASLVVSCLVLITNGCTDEKSAEVVAIIKDELDSLFEDVIEGADEKKDELIEEIKEDVEGKLETVYPPGNKNSAVVTIGGIDKEYHYDKGTENSSFDYPWCTYYAAKEFHKLAPSPGVEWRGDAGQWILEAEKYGWKTTKNHKEVVTGAILVIGNHAQIVRDIKKDGIVVQGMNESWVNHHDPFESDHEEHTYLGYRFYTGYVYKYFLTYRQVESGYYFGDFRGYILPIRSN